MLGVAIVCALLFALGVWLWCALESRYDQRSRAAVLDAVRRLGSTGTGAKIQDAVAREVGRPVSLALVHQELYRLEKVGTIGSARRKIGAQRHYWVRVDYPDLEVEPA